MEIIVASSVRYGKYRNFLQAANKFGDVLYSKEKTIRKFLNLPENIEIIMRPIRYIYGTASVLRGKSNEYMIEIDVRQSMEDFEDTILHELVHIEQYFENRLFLRSEHLYSTFEGREFRLISNKSDEYNNLPWEKEAIEKSAKLRSIIFK
jgi:hypothetical protein